MLLTAPSLDLVHGYFHQIHSLFFLEKAAYCLSPMLWDISCAWWSTVTVPVL